MKTLEVAFNLVIFRIYITYV